MPREGPRIAQADLRGPPEAPGPGSKNLETNTSGQIEWPSCCRYFVLELRLRGILGLWASLASWGQRPWVVLRSNCLRLAGVLAAFDWDSPCRNRE